MTRSSPRPPTKECDVGRVGVVVHTLRPHAVELAGQVATWLLERDHEIRLPVSDAAATGFPEWASDDDAFAKDLDLAVSLGGDGTMLRTVDLVSRSGVPVLGINVGHLGYLTECEPGGWLDALERFFAGDYQLEERMTLDVSVHRAASSASTSTSAFNDAWVERTDPGHTVHLAVSIDGQPFTTYAADALIVATPTGSTAYNLSARGPILSPTLKALVVTPVSPHQLFGFSLVLEPTEAVRVEVVDERPAQLLVDGQPVAELLSGDAVTCRGGPCPARLVRFGDRRFHGILKAKFGLTDR